MYGLFCNSCERDEKRKDNEKKKKNRKSEVACCGISPTP
jgi:hypothetical protein